MVNEAGIAKPISERDFKAKGVIYLPEIARYDHLLNLSLGQNIGQAINSAMEAVEASNSELKDILPKGYGKLDNETLSGLLKNFNGIPDNLEGDAFGMIYEYFLGRFALSEGQGGGEFFTPTSIVKLIVEVIEPFDGKVYDPACGSGGMFVQSANFVRSHAQDDGEQATVRHLSVYGQEKNAETVRIAKMNLAIHGLSGDIREGNTFYSDLHDCVGKFDFVMANPPFNVKGVNFERVKDDPRYSLGIPTTNNANYLWIQHFHASLSPRGRAGFVMANSASDARGSEETIRKNLIKERSVDVMVSVGTNMFFNVTLPCTLWFLDRGKPENRKDKVLFIDAKNIFRQIDRAHREWTTEQVEYIASIVRLYREEPVGDMAGHFLTRADSLESLASETPASADSLRKQAEIAKALAEEWKKNFPEGKYADVRGLCKVATVEEIASQGNSLNAGRYVGIDETTEEEYDFSKRFSSLTKELRALTDEAHELEETIFRNADEILSPQISE